MDAAARRWRRLLIAPDPPALADVTGYGHFEDEPRRGNGRWRIAYHRIFNEAMESRAAPARNPAPPP